MIITINFDPRVDACEDVTRLVAAAYGALVDNSVSTDVNPAAVDTLSSIGVIDQVVTANSAAYVAPFVPAATSRQEQTADTELLSLVAALAKLNRLAEVKRLKEELNIIKKFAELSAEEAAEILPKFKALLFG